MQRDRCNRIKPRLGLEQHYDFTRKRSQLAAGTGD